MVKRVLSIFLVVIFLASFRFTIPDIYSADCSNTSKLFSSNYDVTFSVKKDGSATVVQKVSLKNLSAGCFVSEYSLRINTSKVKNASGNDSLGPLQIKLKKEASSTVLNAKLNDEVTGLGKTVVFTLKYTLNDLAKKEGQIWNLSIPKVATSEKVVSFNLKVAVPSSFGEVFSVNPKPKKEALVGNNTVLNFGKDAILNRGIFVTFGNEQQISFEFKVPLENRQIFSRKFYIPIPPDTENQQVLIQIMDPRPRKIILDESGNYLAEYLVSGREFLEVKISGVVRIINEKMRFASPKTFTNEDLNKYRRESKFVQVQDRLIQEKASELKNPEEIYKFVTSFLTYDINKLDNPHVKRLGAVVSLNKEESATNIDFVDLFVAIARASSIPVREVFGPAITDNQSLKPTFVAEPLNTKSLHVWAQYYDFDKKAWVNVDPTWGSLSTIDYFSGNFPDRFALLFTESDSNVMELEKLTLLTDNLKVNYSREKEDFSPELDLQLEVDQAVAGFPADLEVIFQNEKGVSIVSGKLTLKANGLSLVGEKETIVDPILPFEKKTLKFKIRGGDFFKSSAGTVEATLEAKSGDADLTLTKSKVVTVASLFSLGLQQILLLFIILLLIIGIFVPRLLNKKSFYSR